MSFCRRIKKLIVGSACQSYAIHGRTMNTNIRRISAQPFCRVVASSSTPPEPNRASNITNTKTTVKLSGSPPDLFVLWDEYEKGVGGHKPARDYTPAERGANNKHNYSHRKVFWDAVKRLIERGNTFDTAIDRILAVYGRAKSVKAILNAMKGDTRARNIVVRY